MKKYKNNIFNRSSNFLKLKSIYHQIKKEKARQDLTAEELVIITSIVTEQLARDKIKRKKSHPFFLELQEVLPPLKVCKVVRDFNVDIQYVELLSDFHMDAIYSGDQLIGFDKDEFNTLLPHLQQFINNEHNPFYLFSLYKMLRTIIQTNKEILLNYLPKLMAMQISDIENIYRFADALNKAKLTVTYDHLISFIDDKNFYALSQIVSFLQKETVLDSKLFAVITINLKEIGDNLRELRWIFGYLDCFMNSKYEYKCARGKNTFFPNQNYYVCLLKHWDQAKVIKQSLSSVFNFYKKNDKNIERFRSISEKDFQLFCLYPKDFCLILTSKSHMQEFRRLRDTAQILHQVWRNQAAFFAQTIPKEIFQKITADCGTLLSKPLCEEMANQYCLRPGER